MMNIKLLHAANTGNLPTQPLLVLDYGIPPMITAKENVVKQVLHALPIAMLRGSIEKPARNSACD